MSNGNEVEIEVKVDSKEAEVGMDQVSEKAKQTGEKITAAFNRPRDALGRFTKATEDSTTGMDGLGDSGTKAVQKLTALDKLLKSLDLKPIDLSVNPAAALKSIEATRLKLKELTKAANVSTSIKLDAQKALTGLSKLEKGVKDVEKTTEAAGNLMERALAGFVDLLQQGISTAATAAKSALSNLGQGAWGLLADALTGLLSILPAVIGGFAALGPALLLAGGAAGAAATGFAAAGIGLGTLMIGFGGIGAALSAHTKAMNTAGASSAKSGDQQYQAAKRITDANRALADANRNYVDSVKAVNQARQDEIVRIRELNITLEGEKASQADAAQALVEAKEAARRADMYGSQWEKTNANNAVADAQAQYDAITEKVNQTSAAKAKAAKVGVDGSDQVQAALKAEAQAHEQVIVAEEGLADAHHQNAVAAASAAGATNLFNQAMNNLSPNAKKLVNTLIDLQDRFKAIKNAVQDRVLAGFDTSVKQLADKWLPHLGDILGGTADHINSFGKKLMGALGDSEFIKNIERAGKSGQGLIDNMSTGVDALVDAFGRLAGHSGPVLAVIGKAISGIFTWFDKWIKSADKSGKLDSFMKQAADMLQKVFDLGGKVFKVVGQFIAIIFPSSAKTGGSILDNLSDTMDKISKWLSDPKNQATIVSIADGIGSIVKWVVKEAIPALHKMFTWYTTIVNNIANLFWGLYTTFRTVGNKIGQVWDWISNKVVSGFNWLVSAGKKLKDGLYDIATGFKNGFKDALNWVIDRWNSLSFPLPSFLGGPINLPHIPRLAHGGVAGGLIEVGEHGRELIRVPQGSTVIPHGQTENMIGQSQNGGGRLMLGFDAHTGNRLMDAIVEGLQQYVLRRGGGNVQVALGRHGA